MLYRTKQGGLLLLIENQYYPCTFDNGVLTCADLPLKGKPEIIGVVTLDMAKQMYTEYPIKTETDTPVEKEAHKPVGRRRKIDV